MHPRLKLSQTMGGMTRFARQASQSFSKSAIQAFDESHIEDHTSLQALEQLLCLLQAAMNHVAGYLDDAFFHGTLDDGADVCVAQAIRSRAQHAASWYLHIDVDVAGPEVVPGALTPAPYWPPRQHLLDAATAVTHSVPVDVVSLAAYNPGTDPQRLGAAFGIDIVMAVIAKRIPGIMRQFSWTPRSIPENDPA